MPHSLLRLKVSKGEAPWQAEKAGDWGQVPVLLCTCGLEPVIGHVWPLWLHLHHGTFLCTGPWGPAGDPHSHDLRNLLISRTHGRELGCHTFFPHFTRDECLPAGEVQRLCPWLGVC